MISSQPRNLRPLPHISTSVIFVMSFLCAVFLLNFATAVPFFDDDIIFSEFEYGPVRSGKMRRENAPGREMLMDPVRGVKMGISNANCDDAKTNLTVDWDGSPINYTCYTPKQRIPVSRDILPAVECDNVPKGHMPAHFCMDTKLDYPEPLPTFADHRPLWAQFGEYLFVPPQRWSHDIEHGAVVMLYHPCASPSEVKKLKNIVTGCIWKHVITASNMVPEDRPLVLITWGCRLRMSKVNAILVKNFIKTHALRGPEGSYSKDGQYNLNLIKPASIPIGSTRDDSKLCPDATLEPVAVRVHVGV